MSGFILPCWADKGCSDCVACSPVFEGILHTSGRTLTFAIDFHTASVTRVAENKVIWELKEGQSLAVHLWVKNISNLIGFDIMNLLRVTKAPCGFRLSNQWWDIVLLVSIAPKSPFITSHHGIKLQISYCLPGGYWALWLVVGQD